MSDYERIGRLIEAIERETKWLDITRITSTGWTIVRGYKGGDVYMYDRPTLLAALTEAAERLGIEVTE